MKKDLQFTFHLIFHPFDGFWDMKREKRGQLYLVIIFLLLLPIVYVMKVQATGFLFNYQMYQPVDLLDALKNVGILVGLFCLANWCVTTLMDGEGRLVDIIMVVGYSAVPFILVQIPLSIVSNYFSYTESGIFQFFNVISIGWFAILIFFGIMTVHQYTMFKTVCTMLLTAAGMLIIAFIAIILYNLISQMAGFLLVIYHELRLRL